MIDLSDPQTQVLLFIPIGGLILWYFSRDTTEEGGSNPPAAANPNGKKEEQFLRYNQDKIYSNLLATEEHFRNSEGNKDFHQCEVKHLSLASSHTGEAISHTVAVGDVADSERYRELDKKIIQLQHDVQDNKVSPSEGIQRTREIRQSFESFNTQFDVSRCKACDV
jgi:hypothetical protein